MAAGSLFPGLNRLVENHMEQQGLGVPTACSYEGGRRVLGSE